MITLFDTVSTFPRVRMPWEALVNLCRDRRTVSLVDGAHGVGYIDLTKVREYKPDFFTRNCYK